MPETEYDINDIARMSVAFTVSGVATDPTAVTGTVRKPDGTTTNYTVTTGQIVKDSTGNYHLDVTVDQAGHWMYKLVGTGAATDTAQGTFYVAPDGTDTTTDWFANASLGTSYARPEDVRSTLGLSGTTYSDPDINRAVIAASRVIDSICGRFFYLDTVDTIRYYSPETGYRATIEDITTVTAVAVDLDGDGTFETPLTVNSAVLPHPLNAAALERPYTSLSIHPRGVSAYFSTVWPRSLRVTGRHGWPEVPDAIVQATAIIAPQIYRRSRDAPFGVLGLGTDNVIRIAKADPQVMALTSDYVRLQAW